MSVPSQKMQQRAAILNILKKYLKEEDTRQINLDDDIKSLSAFEDKEYTIRILVKEIANSNETYANICTALAFELSDIETFQKYVLELMRDENIPDKKKFFIISVLKQKGADISKEEIREYINQPETFAQDGIKDFLQDALSDPEVQIDLLDFYINIPQDERVYLLNNLADEFEGDNLANALSLISHIDIEKEEINCIVEALLKTNSFYGIEGLESIVENNIIDTKNQAKINRKIKELNFKYKDKKNTSLIENSKIYKCYTSFIDGSSSFSLVFSRKSHKNLIDTFVIAINIEKGITSCIGFSNIDEENFLSIVKRLFCDSMPVEISPSEAKALFNHYYEKNKKTQTIIPYELFVWKKLLVDIEDLKENISTHITNKLEVINLTEKRARKFMSSKMLETWYFSYGQNKKIDEIINTIEKKRVVDINKINEIVSSEVDSYFLQNKDFLRNLQDKLLFQAFVAQLAKLNASSSCAFSFCFKNNYTKMFITSLIDKSIYYYLSTRLAELNDKNDNLFKQKIKTNYTPDELETIMQQLIDKWEQ